MQCAMVHKSYWDQNYKYWEENIRGETIREIRKYLEERKDKRTINGRGGERQIKMNIFFGGLSEVSI